MRRRAPVPVLRWSPTIWRRMEAIRDRVMFKLGSQEPFIGEDIQRMAMETGRSPIAMHWRKPLSIVEVNQMAPTEEVKARPGRP